MKKLVFGLIWALVFYIGSCAVVVGIAGAQIPRQFDNPQDAFNAGGEAGRKAVEPLVPVLRLESIVVAAAGILPGILPGTGSSSEQNSRNESPCENSENYSNNNSEVF